MYSSDIFDTLITRRTATPTGIFVIVQYRLQKPEYHVFSEYLRKHFFSVRKAAEQQARYVFMSEREITLEQIYSVIGHVCCLSPEEVELLKNMEIEAELEFTAAIDKNINLLLDQLYHDEKVILISDMYLDQNTIRKILVKQNAVFSELPIYVSSEQKCPKANGLYYRVYENEGISFKDWTHMGDHIEVDFNIPNRIGITANHIAFPGLLPWEKTCLSEDDITWQLMCGAARNSRIGREKSDAYEIGTSIGAGILFPYIRWILKECSARGIKHLFFASEESDILHTITECAIEKMCLDIRTSAMHDLPQTWKDLDTMTDPFAFVEVQGTGEAQISLQKSLGSRHIMAFYLRKSTILGSPGCSFLVYMDGYDPVSNSVIETLTRIPHKKTTAEDRRVMEYGFQDYMDGVLETVHNLLELPEDMLWDVDLDKIGWAYLNYLHDNPDERLLDSKAEECQACREKNPKAQIKKQYELNLNEISDRIVLYAAGRVGRALYEQLSQAPGKEIVLWVDTHADAVERSRYAGFPVDIADRLPLVQYDQVVIAVLYEDKALEIKRQLIEQGVPEEKIYWGAYFRDNG